MGMDKGIHFQVFNFQLYSFLKLICLRLSELKVPNQISYSQPSPALRKKKGHSGLSQGVKIPQDTTKVQQREAAPYFIQRQTDGYPLPCLFVLKVEFRNKMVVIRKKY